MSLKYRIAITIFFLEILMMALVLWVTLTDHLEANRKQLEANETVVLGLVADLSRVALLTGEFSELQPYFEQVIVDPGIVQITLADNRKRIVVSSVLSQVAQPMFQMQAEESEYWRSLPINGSTSTLGEIAILFSNASSAQAVVHARNLGIAIALVSMAVIAVVGVIMGMLLTRRIDHVFKATQDFAQGNLDARCAVKGSDEVGQLARSFNHMADNIRSNLDQLKQNQESMRRINTQLEQRVKDRTAKLERVNAEISAFSYSVSHDLRAPLRGITGFSAALVDDYSGQLDAKAKDYLLRIQNAGIHMGQLIDDLLQLSRVSRREMQCQTINLSAMVDSICARFSEEYPNRKAEFIIQDGVSAQGDENLLRVALENLLGNAWKYSSQKAKTRVEFGLLEQNQSPVYFIRDQGTGFNMAYAEQLFEPFRRLHSDQEFEGTGIGLATVQRIIERHGGRVWAESEEGQGACFMFTLQAMET